MSLSAAAAFDQSQRGPSPVLLSKTCQNCFSLKIRCDRTQRTDICDRCARLGKNCVFRPARRRDNSAKRDSRIHALEQQVQDLLRTHQTTPIVQQSIPEGVATAASVAASTPSTLEAHPDGDVIDEDILTIERAETLFELYKSDMMPHFPFVIFPPHVTASSLRYEKAFLFLAVMSVACFHDLGTQERLGERFKYMVSDKVLLGGNEKLPMDHLQGLLIVLAWNHYHGTSKYYSQYLQLAVSLAVDMRLDRKHNRSRPSQGGGGGGNERDPIARNGVSWGPDEQRAAAGTFYISSTIAKLLDKMNTFPCSAFMEEGCLALRQRGEYQTDKDLYHVIRLQRIIENIDTIANQSYTDTEAQDAFLRTRSELEEFRMYLHSDVSDSHLLFMQFHTAKLFLYQVAFFERSLQHSPALHLNTLREGLESAKSFLDLYLWLPPKSEMALTNSEWIQLSFGVTQAAKFAIVSKDPKVESSTRELRQRLNIENVFRHLSLRIGALVGRGGEVNKQKDIFFHYEQRVRKIQNWYEGMVRATGSNSPHNQQVVMSQPTANPQGTHPIPPQHLNSTGAALAPQPVPLTTPGYVPQQPIAYANGAMANPASNNVGMTSLSQAPYTAAYSPLPTIAFPDLMNAPGWDMPFTIPMEDSAWLFDVNNTYQGLKMASPPASDGTWPSPNAL